MIDENFKEKTEPAILSAALYFDTIKTLYMPDVFNQIAEATRPIPKLRPIVDIADMQRKALQKKYDYMVQESNNNWRYSKDFPGMAEYYKGKAIAYSDATHEIAILAATLGTCVKVVITDIAGEYFPAQESKSEWLKNNPNHYGSKSDVVDPEPEKE